jgi:dTDP-4-amino-4,6-dideoxygalactose transaminase
VPGPNRQKAEFPRLILKRRLYLSPPDTCGQDFHFLKSAWESGWIAPLGPQVDLFEREFARKTGSAHAVAVNSGTAALHLALRGLGIGPGDYVVVPSLTFIGSVSPILFQGAQPVFVDSEEASWNMDPEILETVLRRSPRNKIKAVIPVHLYGQAADIDAIRIICQKHGVPMIEDAAEALGATYKNCRKAPGSFGLMGIHSFNGNKIITTSGGGMLVTDSRKLAAMARKLASQARERAPHYEHKLVGYNYRLSNLLAAVGRSQLRDLARRIRRRREHFRAYAEALGDLPGVRMQPEAPWGRSTRWLTCMTLDAKKAGTDREKIRRALEKKNIEARPIWKPMHLQPVFRDAEYHGRGICDQLFRDGLCLPSGSGMSDPEREKVIEIFKRCFE